ncbi:hypothetical protein WR25_14734 isoform B [Diploscapter pachys]|nr:hypothetical protein WR25_14734 isoform B [Diploscapter pachys]
MKPVQPFLIRKKPEISWKGLQYDQSLTILIVDAGFGTLNYMVTDFPRKPKVLVDYRLSDNYHSAPNALVVLAFKSEGKPAPVLPSDFSADSLFDLSKFMLDNDLSDDLVGLSVIIVGSDAFAIERQRVKGSVDYCHSLLKKKLHHKVDEFYSRLPLHHLNSWMSITYQQPAISANVCCRKLSLSAESHRLDPLGNASISALATLYHPTVSSHRIPLTNNFVNYHRHTRTFVALGDDLYTLALIDKDSEVLHWLLVDIPVGELSDAGNKGITIANYLHPAPREPTNCTNFVFLLLIQPSSLAELDAYCQGSCRKRKEFR